MIALAFAALTLIGGPASAAKPVLVAQAAAPSEYTHANELFHERKYREAIAVLDAYLAGRPRDARALVLRGDSKANLGQNAEALIDYNSALKIDPEYQYGYVTRCETRLQLDDAKGALEDCDAGVRLDPKDPVAYEDRADVQFQREAYRSALDDYNRAIELGRSSAYVFAARCDTERILGDRDRARTDCEHALQIDPKSRRGLWSRGRLAIANQRYTDAIGDLNAYIAQNPSGSSTAYYFRGLSYNRLNSYRLALEDLRTYVQRAPDDPDGYRERGLALYGVGRRDAALADLNQAARGYTRDGNAAEADHVAAMVKAVSAGQAPTP